MKKLLALRNKKGFTLVELIVVIAIIAVLVAIAVPAMVSYITNAKQQVNASNCRAVVSAAAAANASVLANVGSGSFQSQVSKLLVDVDTSAGYNKYGGGTYKIYYSTVSGTTTTYTEIKDGDAFSGGKIGKVEYTKDSITATWTDKNTMSFD